MELMEYTLQKVASPLEELTHSIEQHSRRDMDLRDRTYPDLLERLGSNAYLIPLLKSIIHSPRELKRIAGQSYRHVNQFDKIVLVDNNDPQSLRLTLHFWCPPYSQQQLEEELIHEHRFNFWSRILLGNLRSECFVESEEGSEYQTYRYFPSSGGSDTFQDYYQFVKNVRLLKKSQPNRTCDEIYFLSAPTIHRINIDPEALCCTLVLRGQRLRDYSFVYNTSYPSTDTRITNQMFTPETLAEKLAILIEHLEARNQSL